MHFDHRNCNVWTRQMIYMYKVMENPQLFSVYLGQGVSPYQHLEVERSLVCVEGRGRISRSGLTQDIKIGNCVTVYSGVTFHINGCVLCLYTVTWWGIMSCVCGVVFMCSSTLVKIPLLQAGTVVIWPQMFQSDVKPKQSNKQTDTCFLCIWGRCHRRVSQHKNENATMTLSMYYQFIMTCGRGSWYTQVHRFSFLEYTIIFLAFVFVFIVLLFCFVLFWGGVHDLVKMRPGSRKYVIFSFKKSMHKVILQCWCGVCVAQR